eukprot:CAMPEP_0172385930 /NCGR_PEP_ID=MMETSP1061-20121228/3536_1 /TAXON_ID=37318 /ORGANISM="Pseudo-nitzschia pungens, Strain cf. pungens" /LENGTH=391 /DNA_ID=CAMNT_0013115125 /DNA_START=300 /DNA_END=1475 /DNA_ORIENTATION=-
MANDTTATATATMTSTSTSTSTSTTSATASAANNLPPEAENDAENEEPGKDDEIDDDEIDNGEAGESSQPQQQRHREADTDKEAVATAVAVAVAENHPKPLVEGEHAREGAVDANNKDNDNDNNKDNINNDNDNNKPVNASEGGASGRDPPVVPRRPTKRARTAYFIFADEIRSTIQKEHPGETVASQAKRIGARWKSIPQSEKERFQAVAAREKEAARIELEAYRALHGDKALETAQQHPHHDESHEAAGDLVFPVARIRKIAKLDPEVKTLSKEALQLVVRSTEMALAKLGAECVKVARIQNRRTLLPEDVAHVCAHRDVFGFLKDDIRDLAVALAERKNESSSSSSAAAAAAAGSNSKTEKARREAAAGSKPLTSYFGVAAAAGAANK